MIERAFVDTYLFLRYLTNDSPEQANAVDRLLTQSMNGEICLVTNGLVIAEIVWTLESFYKLTRQVIRENVLAILNTPGLEIIDSDLVLAAINGYADQNLDYIDAYNCAWMVSQDLKKAYTFDRKHFNRMPGIRVLVPGDDT
ncbi:MAG: PIN domain-containing protein [Anaerolineales bacterium]|nr:PIN domain-containing protein [Anaerolineales bacterium]